MVTRPFIVHALPRSRTAWLSAFLSFDGWTVWHEPAVRMRSLEDVAALFAEDRVGVCETGAAQGHALIAHLVPGIRTVVVRRPAADAAAAMLAVDLKGVATYDAERLRAIMAYGARALDRIARMPGTLVLEYADLATEAGCRHVFEFCLQTALPPRWGEVMRGTHIEADVPAHLRYALAHRPEIDRFKALCKAEVRRLVYAGELRKAA